MKTTASIALIAAFLAGQAIATINYGKAYYNNGNVDNAIWIDGQDACQYVYQGPNSESPCDYNGGRFTAQNGLPYYLSNCGQSNFDLLNGDYSFNSFAHYNPYSNAGSACNNQYGSYHVDQQWSFY